MAGRATPVEEAASELTQADLDWIRRHRMKGSSPEDVADKEEDPQEKNSQEKGPSQKETTENSDRQRRMINHQWPEVGAILEADYQGEHYEAEVISMPRYKSGKALRILTGPASDEVERSMSGAMLTATEKLREENDLGRKGVANGWEFWQVRKGGESDATN